MLVLVRVEEPKIVFEPPLNDIQEIIHSCFNDIIDGAKGLPRVSTLLMYYQQIQVECVTDRLLNCKLYDHFSRVAWWFNGKVSV